MILGLVRETMDAGARLERICEELGLDPRTVQRWLAQGVGEDRRAGPHHPPGNKLSSAERGKVLAIANAPEHRDLSPKQVRRALTFHIETLMRQKRRTPAERLAVRRRAFASVFRKIRTIVDEGLGDPAVIPKSQESVRKGGQVRQFQRKHPTNRMGAPTD